jgi:LemA protein
MELFILGLIVVVGLVVILIYNRLVALRQTTRQAWGDIDVQLKQRHDLVPNLVETVKGYASHEKETLENVIKARQTAIDVSGSTKELAQAENMLSGALRQLFALAESYPDLKANTNFLELQTELADLENKIAAARRFFNNAVAEYNTAIEQFPAVVLANSFRFKAEDFFEVAATERAAPSVKF